MNRHYLTVAAITAVSAAALAAPLMTAVDHRALTSLNGSWRTIVDPYENGFYDYRYEESQWGFFRDARPRDKSDLVEYGFDNSPLLLVPGDWNSQAESLFFYEGTIWYRRLFDYPRLDGKRLFVYFGAANYDAVVYLNGRKLGRHVGGFTPFNFEITDVVREKNNVLVVKVDNKRYREAVPTVNTDWWNYGGLTRRVLLVETPATFIRDTFIQLKKDSTDTIAGWIQLDGPQREQTVSVRIPEAGVNKTYRTDRDGKIAFEFKADLTLWSTQSPKLYDVFVAAETDTLKDTIGFRSIQTKGTQILLNGKPIFLRGICIHEESPLRGGRATGPEDARILMDWAQELGCNFVRLAHYPHNEFMVREADKRGILVWSEIPVYWTILFDNEGTYQNAEAQLAAMITRDKNRASVVLWSVANETPVSDIRLRFLRRLVDKTRDLDPTRLVTAAMERTTVEKVVHVDDPLGEYLDVLGCNEYSGWYWARPGDCAELTWESKYDKPLIMSEFGGGCLQGYHADAETRWSEEYLVALYEGKVEMLRKIPSLAGTSPWLLKDFRSPRRQLPGIQDFWNRKGLYSSGGQKKQAFYVMQAYYRQIAESETK